MTRPPRRKPGSGRARRQTAPQRGRRSSAIDAPAGHPASEKLQKVLARAGLGSRREIEQWIRAGRITVNGSIAAVGDRVGRADRIRLDGEPVTVAPVIARCRVLAYHKPEGEWVTRSAPDGRPSVFQHLPALRRGRWIAVGRLDVSTSGLLLFTNDGELAHRLMHPSSAIEREYAVRVLGTVTDETIQRLMKGAMLDDGPARFDGVLDAGGQGANHWYHVVLREGRHHEVRRLWESQGVKVSRLIRVRYGSVMLNRRLRPGRWEELESAAVDALRHAAALSPQRQRGYQR